MSEAASESPPKGWYPDPTGAPQWRIWNGTTWSEHVRDFTSPAPSLATSLEAIRATAMLERGGAACFFAGIGLLIDVHHHHAALVARGAALYGTLLTAGLLLLFLGHLSFARAGAAIAPRERWPAVVPILNAIVWPGWACERASYPLPTSAVPLARRRDAADRAVLAQGLWLAVLAGVAYYPESTNTVVAVIEHAAAAVPACLTIWWAHLLRVDLTSSPAAVEGGR